MTDLRIGLKVHQTVSNLRGCDMSGMNNNSLILTWASSDISQLRAKVIHITGQV